MSVDRFDNVFMISLMRSFVKNIVSVLFLLSFAYTSTSEAKDLTTSQFNEENTIVVNSGYCRIELFAHNRAAAKELDKSCNNSILEIFVTLNGKTDKSMFPVSVKIVAVPAQIEKVAPQGVSIPKWADAVALPNHNLIVLSLHNRMGSPIQNLDTVFLHELSHLALRRAIGEAKVPRWFSEGIAIRQSEESVFQRHWLVWNAARTRSIMQLSQIEEYPEQLGKIDLSYAQAADFLSFLLQNKGWLGIRSLIRRTAKGEPFDDAFQYVFGQSLNNMEASWRVKLFDRWKWLSIFTSDGFIWGFILVLFFIAYAATMRRKKKKLAQMQLEEDAVARVIETVEALAATKLPSSPKIASIQACPTKIRIDDDIHTLH